MRLSLYTDFALRLLMYLAGQPPEAWATTPEVARVFGISAHHLQKSAQGLVRAGFVQARQGRSGGLRLAKPVGEIRLGAVVAELEGSGCLIDCERGPCPLAGHCALKHAIDNAERSFLRELDRFTLADVTAGRTGDAVRSLSSRASGLLAAEMPPPMPAVQ
ncbi:Rrf2 family transcriptional regulator [Methylobacterium organophilum]|uniref:RrF2 family transcriptional regulator n=1 Tax=Methylobacterium organophilum TaxID=410 RepID=UPI001F134C77|nr:Rrf2 family transcriptional regulator [Methylobacterium organophilum]UMY18221.1 Rrf2 family transcriptional regulator [Methylobacterium organophilum]